MYVCKNCQGIQVCTVHPRPDYDIYLITVFILLLDLTQDSLVIYHCQYTVCHGTQALAAVAGPRPSAT